MSTSTSAPSLDDIVDLLGTIQTTQAEEGQPLHRRISASLSDLIKRGDLRPGTMLPPEVELARSFGVSRHTMRASLDALVRDGLIERRRGRGTVVLRPRIEQNLTHFYSTAQEMRHRGANLRTRVLERGRLYPGDELSAQAADGLGLSSVELGGYVVRLRFVDDEPLFLETVTFPLDLCEWLIKPEGPGRDPAELSFYDELAKRKGTRVTRAHETIRPDIVSGHVAELLGVPDDTSVFVIERQSYAGERCVEWRQTIARGDRYTFTVDLVNPDEDNGA